MEQDMIEKIRLLEDKIVKVVDALKKEREENKALNAKVTALDDEIRAKEEEIRALRSDREESGEMKQSLADLRKERSVIHSQVESLLKELESIELA